MPTITIKDQEYALAPLSLADMERIESEVETRWMAAAEKQIERIYRLRIGTDQDAKAILATAMQEIQSGAADERFVRSSAGMAFVLWISANRTKPIPFKEFKESCRFQESRKLKFLLDGLLGEVEKPKDQPWDILKAQEDRRARIFNALCDGEKMGPMDLKTMVEADPTRAVALFCKYAGVKECDLTKLKERIEEYIAAHR
jgi:hypothetical protein